MNCLVVPIGVLIFLVSIIIGIFLWLRPATAIELQRRFYARINWRIEPISMEKEIRNTRMMGLFLTVTVITGLIYLLAGVK